MNSKYQKISTPTNYEKILNTGLFFEIYPELTGNWYEDKNIIKKKMQKDLVDG
jgi:hypothetical protein